MARLHFPASAFIFLICGLTAPSQANQKDVFCANDLIAQSSSTSWWNHPVFFRAVAEEAITHGADHRETLTSFLEQLKRLPEAESQKVILSIEARIQQLVAFSNSPELFSEITGLVQHLKITPQMYEKFVSGWRAVQSDNPSQVRVRLLSVLTGKDSLTSYADLLDGILSQTPHRKLMKLGRRELLTDKYSNTLKKSVASFLRDSNSRPETRSSRLQGYYDFLERMTPLSHKEYGALAMDLIEGAYNEMNGAELYAWLRRFQDLTHLNRTLPLAMKDRIAYRTRDYLRPEHFYSYSDYGGPLRHVIAALPPSERKPSLLDPFDW